MNTLNPFARLAPFIQEYIWQHGWTEIRAVQAEASQAIFDTDDHVLISSGTASGKTEAAFLPILTLLHQQPSASIGVLYIGPLKALINDQFYRLQRLLDESGIAVAAWHGDVSASAKGKTVERAQGILQITPESLEALCLRKNNLLRHLFQDLRFVVIDEVHAFMGDERGRQVLCLLERLERVIAKPPRRVGLSATLGDLPAAQRWLAGRGGRPVTLVNDQGGKRKLQLALEHFMTGRRDDEEDAYDYPGLYEHLYQHTSRGKSLIFRNKRQDVEETVVALRELAERLGTPDIYHSHHGSVAAGYREDAENAMREEGKPACTVATVTLELGIDLGQLERVLQVDPPQSVSSFVQRLGRTGRRGEPGEMILYTLEDFDEQAPPHQQLPWNLLQTIATMQLYLEERWVEGAAQPQLPFSLLVHQTLAALTQYGELTPRELAAATLTLTPFQGVQQEHYREFLRHLLTLELVQRTDEGGLILGLAGEKLVDHWRFYAVFKDQPEFAVIHGSSQIGTVSSLPAPGQVISLIGRSWLVTGIDERRKQAFVKRHRGRASSAWFGAGGETHDRVVQKMREVLNADVTYAYLQPAAQTRLNHARALGRETGIATASLLPISDHQQLYLPWRGTVVQRTLGLILSLDREGKTVKSDASGYTLSLNASRTQLLNFLENLPSEEQIAEALKYRYLQHPPEPEGKFDPYVPAPLLAEAFVSDQLNISVACQELHVLRHQLQREQS